MSTDLRGQIRELMDRGLRPVTMADIQTRAPVRVTVVRRVAARSGFGRGRLILAGAAGIAAGVAVAVAALLPGGTGNSTGTTRLAAWTVVKQPDGGVMVTLHQLREPAQLRQLQRTLRADGIPAHVSYTRSTSVNWRIPGCHVYPLGGPRGTPLRLWRKVFYGPHARPLGYRFWIYPAAIPHGQGVALYIHYLPAGSSSPGRPGIGYSLDLVKASPQCTGS